MSTIQELEDKIKALETAFSQVGYSIKNAVTTDSVRRTRLQSTSQAVYGMQIALCVSTDDPLSQGRIRIYHPVFDGEYDPNIPNSLPDPESLSWCSPISSLGGFDDCGTTWVPPAGSKVAVIYLEGSREQPFYLGTIHDRHRGPDGQHTQYWYNYPAMEEYYRFYEGRRNGYNFGDNSGDQVLPPWNNENYKQYDWDDSQSFYAFSEERQANTIPHIYGMKTPQKHWLKFVDGDPNCNYKGRRIELATARGAGLFLKDDHLTPYSQYGYNGSAPIIICDNLYPCCESGAPTPFAFGQQCPLPGNDGTCGPQSSFSDINKSDIPSNPFQKRKEEEKYYIGNKNLPAGYKVDLPQSGVYLTSPSGNFIAFDDSVNQPFGVPTWDSEFNFGCDNQYSGKLTIGEATGHFIRLNGKETAPNIRGEENGVEISTAFGNYIKLSDHTEQAGESCTSPPNFAGEKRGIEAGTNSGHMFVMSDRGLKASGSEARKYSPVSQIASETGYTGYCMLRSGYGLQLLMADNNIQSETDAQLIVLQAPQKTNYERGASALIMQEQASGPGYLFLRAGGVMILNSYDEMLETVGTEENPASKFTSVSDSYIVQCKGFYFNHSENILMWGDKSIYLLGGNDCTVPEDSQTITEQSTAELQALSNGEQPPPSKVPCIHQVITSKDPWICPMYGVAHFGVTFDDQGNIKQDSRSDRVFVSASS